MDFSYMFGQMAVLFFVVIVGYGANKAGFLDGDLNRRLSALATLVIALGRLRVPALAGQAIGLLGQITTPAALLIIGSSLAQLPLRSILGGPRVWAVTAVRLLLLPAVLWLILRPLVSDPLILGVAVVIAGMPVASNCTMLCLQYGGDQKLASQGTFLTTLFSLVTIPLLASLLL